MDDLLRGLERCRADALRLLGECLVEEAGNPYPRERSERILPALSEPFSLPRFKHGEYTSPSLISRQNQCVAMAATASLAKMPRQLPISFTNAMGRQQANNNAFYNNTAKTWKRDPNYVPLSERLSTEWDLRLDLTTQLTATSIVEAAKVHKGDILWGLVSGIEYGKSRNDRPSYGNWSAESEQFHVHIAVIFNKKVDRETALKTFRAHKVAGEYAVPRDQKQTYAGWRMHHRKPQTKIDEVPHLWEYGTFPIDQLTDDNGRKVLAMRRMYGRDEDDQMFQVLLDVGRRVQAELEANRKRKQRDELEELRAEVKRLRALQN